MKTTQNEPFDVTKIVRPDPALMRYYVLCALATGPMFPVTLGILLCRYYTLRFRFDDAGITLCWGVLFRRETYLTYKRIQDIHLNRNLVERWLGLATLSVETASGSSTPEMKIEGVLQADRLRDYLYSQMRGTRSGTPEPIQARLANDPEKNDEVLELLTSIRDQLSTRLASDRSNEGSA